MAACVLGDHAVCADRSNVVAPPVAVKAQTAFWGQSNGCSEYGWVNSYGDENDPYHLTQTDLASTSCSSAFSADSTQSWSLGSYPEHDGSMDCDLVSNESLHSEESLQESSSPGSTFPDQFVPLEGSSQELLLAIRSAKQQEQEVSADKTYLQRHNYAVLQNNYITARMRNITAGWMVEVAIHFQLQPETLFLAVNLLDRYLSKSQAFPRNMLQLLAVTALMVAAKQEEVSPPSVEVLTEIAAHCFTQEDLIRMEHVLLHELDWRSQAPTTFTFLSMFSQAMEVVPWDVFNLASYFGELAATEYAMLEFAPSTLAASGLLLGALLSGQDHLVARLEEASELSCGDCKSAAHCMLRLHNLVFESCRTDAESTAIKPFKTVHEKHVGLGCSPVIRNPIQF